MPPKRKAAATKAKAGGKKAKKGEEDDVSTSMKEAFEALKQADAGKKKKTKVDQHCPYANTASVSYQIVIIAFNFDIGLPVQIYFFYYGSRQVIFVLKIGVY